MEIKTRGLVLRVVNYKDADRIITVLTETNGKLTVSARSVRGKNSKFAASTQQFAFADMELYSRQGKWYLREARTIEIFSGLSRDIGLLALGAYFAELLEALSDEDSQQPDMLPLGLSALYILSSTDRPPEQVKAAFEMRLMCIAGYEPQVDYCSNCHRTEPVGPVLDLAGGEIVCSGCRRGGEYVKLCGGSYEAIKYIINAAPERVFLFALGPQSAKRLADACEQYLLFRLERSLRTLDFWKGVK